MRTEYRSKLIAMNDNKDEQNRKIEFANEQIDRMISFLRLGQDDIRLLMHHYIETGAEEKWIWWRDYAAEHKVHWDADQICRILPECRQLVDEGEYSEAMAKMFRFRWWDEIEAFVMRCFQNCESGELDVYKDLSKGRKCRYCWLCERNDVVMCELSGQTCEYQKSLSKCRDYTPMV